MITKITRNSFSKDLETIRKQFLGTASKSALRLLIWLTWSLDPADPMYPQVEYAEDLGIDDGDISKSVKELVKHKFLIRCKLRSRVLYYLNPEHYWSGTEEERARQIDWLKNIECPAVKPKRAKKKPATAKKAKVLSIVSKGA